MVGAVIKENVVFAEEKGRSGVPMEKERRNKYATACAVIASMISIVMGYDTGVMSGANLFIKEDLQINDTQIQVLNGILNLFALVGSVAAGRTSDKIGRRYTIVVASVVFLVGALLMGFAPSFVVLMTGRCVAGTGVGFALMIAPVYSAEISSPSYRGSLTCLPEICISFGILLGYISNYGFSKLPLIYGWRVMLGLAAVPALLLAFMIFMMPESPRWLVMQGRVGAARSVLLKVSNSQEEAELRLQAIKSVAGVDDNEAVEHSSVISRRKITTDKGVLKELLLKPSPAVKRVLLIALGIHFFQHVTGIEAVVLYSPRIFHKAGIQTKGKLLLATMGVGVTKVVFIILVASTLVNKIGRRPLLLTSMTGMVLSLVGLGTALTEAEHSRERLLGTIFLAIGSVISFVAFFSIGLGPVTWVYTSEIWPLRFRAQGMSLGVAVNRVMNATVSMTFVSLYNVITIGGAFYLFAGFGVLAWAFFYCLLPETRGRSLEDMEELFSEKRVDGEEGEVVVGHNNDDDATRRGNVRPRNFDMIA